MICIGYHYIGGGGDNWGPGPGLKIIFSHAQNTEAHFHLQPGEEPNTFPRSVRYPHPNNPIIPPGVVQTNHRILTIWAVLVNQCKKALNKNGVKFVWKWTAPDGGGDENNFFWKNLEEHRATAFFGGSIPPTDPNSLYDSI